MKLGKHSHSADLHQGCSLPHGIILQKNSGPRQWS